jgi:hypothetical protein
MACCTAIYNHPIIPGVYNPPVGIQVYTTQNIPIAQIPISVRYVPVLVPSVYMKFVIGTNGYYFNAITRASNVDYIWYHKESNVIEIRGFEGYMNEAENRLISRMKYIESTVIKNILNSIVTPEVPITQKKTEKWADMEDDGEPFEFEQ